MAGVKPFFITGANAKIKVNGVTLAFCTNLNYRVKVVTADPHILGMHEAVSLEPLSYSVEGSFMVVRYAKGATEGNNNFKASKYGNGIGSWGPDNKTNGLSGVLEEVASTTLGQLGGDGRAYDNMDPASLKFGTTFNIEVWQKTKSSQSGNDVNFGQRIGNAIVSDTLGLGADRESLENLAVARIRNCRIVDMGFQIDAKGIAREQYMFKAIYVDEDTFLADTSGRGQKDLL